LFLLDQYVDTWQSEEDPVGLRHERERHEKVLTCLERDTETEWCKRLNRVYIEKWPLKQCATALVVINAISINHCLL